jgi:cobyrinic acid a,c-diamide synthase
MAAGHPCFNLDPFLMGKTRTVRSFALRSGPGAVSLIEGNRGLFDGLNTSGSYSSAELAKALHCPVVLILDCTKATRTVAAMVYGCQRFDREVDLKGVVLNHIARSRHEAVISKAIERYCRLPVLGAIPRMPSSHFPERHLGLLPFQEHPEAGRAVEAAKVLVEKYLDLKRLLEIARKAPAIGLPLKPAERQAIRKAEGPKIGIIQDVAFQFYYPENLEALKKEGAELVVLDALSGAFPPDLDGLYIGGGFPETQGLLLAENQGFRSGLNKAVRAGLPVYAECGGLMYLGRSIIYKERTYPMVGALPLTFVLETRPQGHGYTRLKVEKENPFFPVGMALKGHEFHYSRVVDWKPEKTRTVFRMLKGFGLDGRVDGLCHKGLLATYTHVHALGTPAWARGLVDRARAFRNSEKRVLP